MDNLTLTIVVISCAIVPVLVAVSYRPKKKKEKEERQETNEFLARIFFEILSDAGNANRVDFAYKDHILYTDSKSFLLWNGKYWEAQREGKLIEIVGNFFEKMYREAVLLSQEKKIVQWLLNSSSKASILNTIFLLKEKVRIDENRLVLS